MHTVYWIGIGLMHCNLLDNELCIMHIV